MVPPHFHDVTDDKIVPTHFHDATDDKMKSNLVKKLLLGQCNLAKLLFKS